MPPAVESHTDQQSAVRLLAAICAAATPVDDGKFGDDVVGVLRAQSRLQALDFWIRYPDYLANELLAGRGKRAVHGGSVVILSGRGECGLRGKDAGLG